MLYPSPAINNVNDNGGGDVAIVMMMMMTMMADSRKYSLSIIMPQEIGQLSNW
jgi:hypothetical protein